MSDHSASPSNATRRHALVTGASSGIGAATVRRLTAAGWYVTGVARRADRLEALAADTGCSVHVLDVTDDAAVAGLADVLRASRESGAPPVDAVVLNAGLAIGVDPVVEASTADWARMFDVNVLGAQRVLRVLVPMLRDAARVRGGADIVAVTSTAGQRAYEGGAGYSASKAGLRIMMDALRLELAGEPLRVMQVAPGMVRTDEFTLNRLGGDAERSAALYEGVVRPLTADDVARVIVDALGLPAHINVDEVTMRPVAQAAQHKLVRGPLSPR
jgi:NADP-dependent 3-hydroxy acid dehydrogenase YdfG